MSAAAAASSVSTVTHDFANLRLTAPSSGPFSKISTMMFDLHYVLKKRKIHIDDLQQLHRVFVERLPEMTGEHILLSIISMTALQKEISEKDDYSELGLLLCLTADILSSRANFEEFTTLFGEVSWIKTLLAADKTKRISTCCSIAHELDVKVNSYKEPDRNGLDAKHPFFINKQFPGRKDFLMYWYAICFYLHEAFSDLLNEKSQQFLAQALTNWYECRPSCSQIVKVSAFLNLIPKFLPQSEANSESKKEADSPPWFRRLSLSGTFKSTAGSPPKDRLHYKQKSPLSSVRPISASPPADKDALLAARNARKDGLFLTFCKEFPKGYQQVWLSSPGTYIILKQVLANDAMPYAQDALALFEEKHKIQDDINMPSASQASSGHGMSWLSCLDSFEIEHLASLIQKGNLNGEKLLAIYNVLINAGKDKDTIDSRLKLSASIISRFKNENLPIEKSGDLFSLTNMFYGLLNLISQTKDLKVFDEFKQSFKEQIDALFESRWRFSPSTTEHVRVALHFRELVFNVSEDVFEDKALLEKKIYAKCIEALYYELKELNRYSDKIGAKNCILNSVLKLYEKIKEPDAIMCQLLVKVSQIDKVSDSKEELGIKLIGDHWQTCSIN